MEAYLKHGEIWNQSSSSMCSAYSLVKALQCLYGLYLDETVELSKLFNYRDSKLNDNVGELGTSLSYAASRLNSNGTCESYLYDVHMDNYWKDKVFPTPSKEAIENAKSFKKFSYVKTNEMSEIKDAITKGYGVAFALNTYSNYFEDYYGFLLPPKNGSVPNGGHGIACVGFNDELVQVIKGVEYKGAFVLADSHGVEKGWNGHKFLMYDLFNATGKYSRDKMVDYAIILKPNRSKDIVYKDYHKGHKIDLPKIDISLTLGSSIAKKNGKELKLPIEAGTINGHTMIPFRWLCENMGYKVHYYNGYIKARNENHKRSIEMWVGSTEMKVNGKGSNLAIKPQVINGHTMIPLRAFGEATGCIVGYNKGIVTIKGMI